jgi:uncharacterized protein
MDFEWDEAKATANFQKHGVSFVKAVAVFDDGNRVTTEDVRYQYDEPRFTAYGLIQGRLHVVVFTNRADAVRLISARKANKRELKKHGNRTLQT